MSTTRTYEFRRRAKNESNSGRTARIGIWKNTLKEAIAKAYSLSVIHNTPVTISDRDTGLEIATINEYSILEYNCTNIEILSSHFQEIIR